jgi:hypothetical protein
VQQEEEEEEEEQQQYNTGIPGNLQTRKLNYPK